MTEARFHVDGRGYAAFFCPGCERVHVVRVTGADAWIWNGSTTAPTLNPSVLLDATPTAPRCHSCVIDGRIQFLDDCDHHLKGQRVDLPQFEYPFLRGGEEGT